MLKVVVGSGHSFQPKSGMPLMSWLTLLFFLCRSFISPPNIYANNYLVFTHYIYSVDKTRVNINIKTTRARTPKKRNNIPFSSINSVLKLGWSDCKRNYFVFRKAWLFTILTRVLWVHESWLGSLQLKENDGWYLTVKLEWSILQIYLFLEICT